MSRSADALIKPELLVWARDAGGFAMDEAAQKIGVSEEKLTSWELGESTPTVIQLRKVAQVYKRPFAVFYLSEPPTTFKVPHDFRTLGDASGSTVSPALRVELRRVSFHHSIAQDLGDEDDYIPFAYRGYISQSDSIEQAALKGRQILGVSLADVAGWDDEYKALNGWRNAIESIGVLVFQLEGVEVNEIRGFSVAHKTYPVIAINGKDSPAGRIFTLFHELGHLLLNDSGMCDLHDADEPKNQDQQVEKFCNSFAAAALMPREAVIRAIGVEQVESRTDWRMEDIAAAASVFNVSREAMLRRLVTLGATTFGFYLEQRGKILKEYAEIEKRNREKKGGRGPSQPVQALKRVGLKLTEIVLRAYDREDITSSDLSEYLGVRLKHIPKIRDMVFKPRMTGKAS